MDVSVGSRAGVPGNQSSGRELACRGEVVGQEGKWGSPARVSSGLEGPSVRPDPSPQGIESGLHSPRLGRSPHTRWPTLGPRPLHRLPAQSCLLPLEALAIISQSISH